MSYINTFKVEYTTIEQIVEGILKSEDVSFQQEEDTPSKPNYSYLLT